MITSTLNKRATIQTPEIAQDVLGQPLLTWADVATVWANVTHLSGLESIRADSETAIVRASIRIRYRAGITPGMRVLVAAQFYNVKAVLMDHTNKVFTDLTCELVA
jgi:SPP1 family predicted phage head-tail adaptor